MMKTIFDPETRNEVIDRIHQLSAGSKPQWGKMNVFQMLNHCVRCEEMYLGKVQFKRTLMGRIFGQLALKNILRDERPLARNAPTSNHFKIREIEGDVESEKKKWISLVKEYGQFSNDPFEHWFFGKMTKEQVGYFVYKHSDHHLRQFNV